MLTQYKEHKLSNKKKKKKEKFLRHTIFIIIHQDHRLDCCAYARDFLQIYFL
jgi:hypothetical protein